MRCAGWRGVQQEEQFGVCQWTHCAAPPFANRWALKFELKLNLKPEGGRDYLFSEACLTSIVGLTCTGGKSCCSYQREHWSNQT